MLLYKDIHYDARVQREALALANEGHRVYIACVREYTDNPSFSHENIILIRISISVKSAKSALSSGNTGKNRKKNSSLELLIKLVRNPYIKVIKDFAAYFEFYKKVLSAIKETDVDVIHSHDLNTLWQGYLLRKVKKVPLIYDSHELFNEMAGRNPVDRKIGYYMEERLYKKVDFLITVNEVMLSQFDKRYGKKESVIVQNVPIYSEKLLADKDNRNYFRDTFRLKNNDVILIYQGGLSPHRGIELCISAIAELPDEFKLVIVGQGISESSLKSLTSEMKLNDRIFFHPQVPSSDILWYTSQGDIGLVMYQNTSLNNYYSTPNKIFEYMQAGIPCVASDHPGKTYIVDNYRTGISTEETVEAITQSVLKIHSDYPYYRDNCIIAREIFTWENEKTDLLDLYTSINADR